MYSFFMVTMNKDSSQFFAKEIEGTLSLLLPFALQWVTMFYNREVKK